MEADGALSLVLKLDEKTKSMIFVEAFVSDDDSSLRAIMRHQNPKGKGMLPPHIPEPKWLADPSHRTKVVANAIFALVNNKPKVDCVCSNADALRIKKYFGYMLNEGRWLTLEQFCEKSKAVVEHLFNCHDFCNHKWCFYLVGFKNKQIEKNKPIYLVVPAPTILRLSTTPLGPKTALPSHLPETQRTPTDKNTTMNLLPPPSTGSR